MLTQVIAAINAAALLILGTDPLAAQGQLFLNLNPSWSPDGRQLVFESERHAGTSCLYIIDADGNNERRLTWTKGSDTQPSWSPDGERILFSGTGSGVDEVYMIDRDGSGLTRLTHGGSGVR
jgi:TolB protein